MKNILATIGNITGHGFVFFVWGTLKPGAENLWHIWLLQLATILINAGIGPYVGGFVSGIMVDEKSGGKWLVLLSGAVLSPLIRKYVDGAVFILTTSDAIISLGILCVDVFIGYLGIIQAKKVVAYCSRSGKSASGY